MKKLLKVTLSLLCALAMTGCGSKENENDTNSKKEDTKTVEKEEKTSKSKYFDNFDKEVKLKSAVYSIFVPKNAYSYDNMGTNLFEIEDNDENTINVMLLSGSVYGEKANDIKSDEIDGLLSEGKKYAMNSMYNTSFYNLKVESSKTEELQNYNGICKYGQLDIDGKLINCMEFSFILSNQEEEKDLCEIIVCSDDYEEKDLKNIAEELISQIHETE